MITQEDITCHKLFKNGTGGMKPMEQRNDPSTEEIVRNFRGAHIFGITQALENRIADRLESQEAAIAALTSRAERAERERDAAVAVIGIQAKKLKESHVVLCNICKFEDMIGCVHKNHCDGYQLFKWRVLPQDGEGV